MSICFVGHEHADQQPDHREGGNVGVVDVLSGGASVASCAVIAPGMVATCIIVIIIIIMIMIITVIIIINKKTKMVWVLGLVCCHWTTN